MANFFGIGNKFTEILYTVGNTVKNKEGIMKVILIMMIILSSSVFTYSKDNLLNPAINAAVEAGTPAGVAVMAYDISINLDIDYAMLVSQIFVESSYRAKVVSSAGAFGYMQIMKIAETEVNKIYGLDLDRYNPQENIMLGVLFLRHLQKRMSVEDSYRYYNGGWNFKNISKTKDYYNNIVEYAKIINDRIPTLVLKDSSFDHDYKPVVMKATDSHKLISINKIDMYVRRYNLDVIISYLIAAILFAAVGMNKKEVLALMSNINPEYKLVI